MPPLTFSGSGFVSPQGSHQNGSLRHSMEYTLAICPIFRGHLRQDVFLGAQLAAFGPGPRRLSVFGDSGVSVFLKY